MHLEITVLAMYQEEGSVLPRYSYVRAEDEGVTAGHFLMFLLGTQHKIFPEDGFKMSFY